MGSKKRKRRLFTGETPIGGPSVKSKRAARKITSSFHKIQNEIGSLLTSSMSSTSSAGEERVRVLEQQLEEMGGRKRYQQASVVTTSQHKTSKWVVSVLKKLGLYQNATAKEKTKLRVLEVGAVNIQLQQYSGLSVRAIDINSQHPSIEEKDFFDIIPSAEWDVVVCAMVVNCVDTPTRRAEMLIKLSGHLKPNKGILFLILPTKCIKNEFLSPALFRAFLRAIDLDVPSDDTEYYSKLFPQKTCQEPLDDYCSRSTPKLSFFVLVHREPSRSLEMAKQDDIHPKLCNSNWFINPKFSHIMESVKAAVEEGTIKSFIQTDEADFKCKVGSKFNSNDFNLAMPRDIMKHALQS